MTLSRLASTTHQFPQDSVERGREASRQSIRRVEPIEPVINGRERSLMQELAEVDPRLSLPFAGGAKTQSATKEIARALRISRSRSLRRSCPMKLAHASQPAATIRSSNMVRSFLVALRSALM